MAMVRADRIQKTEYRRQKLVPAKAGNGGQMTEDRGQKTETREAGRKMSK
jgi:hypothetical protein